MTRTALDRERTILNEAVKLTVPHARPYYGVVRLVVGGVAARFGLSLELLEDLQLGLDTLLANEAYAAGAEVTLEVAVRRDTIEVAIGPLDAANLERDFAGDADATAGVGLRRLLTTVGGDVGLERRDGGGWIRMRKLIPGRELTAPA